MRCTDAPRNVFIVRCASGVIRIRQRPVASPAVAAGVSNPTPDRPQVVREDLAELVSLTLPTYCARAPNDATPTIVFAADPPEICTPGPIAS